MDLQQKLLFSEVVERHLAHKRHSFAQDYGFDGKPDLVWQSMPLDNAQIDITNDGVQGAVGKGSGVESEYGWWYGFQSGASHSLVFDGVASSRLVDKGWASELHLDGHVIAALWSFPQVRRPDGSEQLAIPTFFAEAFKDFGSLVQNCYRAAGYSGAFALTCTLEMADQLALAGPRENVIAQPVRRNVLRWPLLPLANANNVEVVTYAMGVQLMRAYGKKLKPW